MDTRDQHHLSFAITADDAKKIQADFQEAKQKCYEKSIENMNNDLKYIDDILADIQIEDVTFDELVTPLHNLISIVPQEQYRFLGLIRSLFKDLPDEIKHENDVHYARMRLKELKKKYLDNCIQQTDLSQYWCLYRVTVNKYYLSETDAQIECQNKILNVMKQVAVNTIARRTIGIRSVNTLIRNGI